MEQPSQWMPFTTNCSIAPILVPTIFPRTQFQNVGYRKKKKKSSSAPSGTKRCECRRITTFKNTVLVRHVRNKTFHAFLKHFAMSLEHQHHWPDHPSCLCRTGDLLWSQRPNLFWWRGRRDEFRWRSASLRQRSRGPGTCAREKSCVQAVKNHCTLKALAFERWY